MKTKKLFLMMIAAAAIAFAGCKEDDDETASVLDVDKTAIDAAHIAGSYAIAVTCNAAWTAIVNAGATWCTVQPASGAGSGMVTVNVADNATAGTRTATVTFIAGALTQQAVVTQAAAARVLSVDRTTIEATVDAAAYIVGVTGNVAWTASVNAGATWCTVQPASGNGNGAVTVNVASTTVTRSTTVTFAAGTLTRAVNVMQAMTMPLHAASAQTWTFGYQTWSDAIHIPECNKTDFTGSDTDPHCRSYTENGETWYYYNWPYVIQNAATLCPSPWRVPSVIDINTLDINTDAMTLMDKWGYGGYVQGIDNSVNEVSSRALYWSASVRDISEAYLLYYFSEGLYPLSSTYKYIGSQVRCVK